MTARSLRGAPPRHINRYRMQLAAKDRLADVRISLTVEAQWAASYGDHSDNYRRTTLHNLLAAMPAETRVPIVEALIVAGPGGYRRADNPVLRQLAEQAAHAQVAAIGLAYKLASGAR